MSESTLAHLQEHIKRQIEVARSQYLDGSYGGDERTQHIAYTKFRTLRDVGLQAGMTDIESNDTFLKSR